MSSYIIAGSSDNLDMVYCEEISKIIKAKYTNIDFRIIIKHPSEWEAHLHQVCRIYGFRIKSNPIIYTFDGKIIGDKVAFLKTANKYFGIGQDNLRVGQINTQINKKHAQEQLHMKFKLKNKEHTLLQQINFKLQQLLKNKILHNKTNHYQKIIEKGFLIYKRELDSPYLPVQINQKKIDPKNEDILPADIDIMALSLRDQPHLIQEEQHLQNKQKQHITTHTEQILELKREKTNASIIKGHENPSNIQTQSKHQSHNRQNKSVKNNTQIQEQFFQESKNYDLIDIEKYIIKHLGQEFYLIFAQNWTILGELEIVKSVPTQDGVFKISFENHPREIKGHIFKQKIDIQKISDQIKKQTENVHHYAQRYRNPTESNTDLNNNQEQQQELEGEVVRESYDKKEVSKSLHIQASSVEIHDELESILPDLQSNINSRLLYLLKPLSNIEISKIYKVINNLSSIVVVQMSPTNPCPNIKIYPRKILKTMIEGINNNQIFLSFQKNMLEKLEEGEKVNESQNFIRYREFGFLHLIKPYPRFQDLGQTIKKMIMHFLPLQLQLNKFIGYNLVFSCEYVYLIPIIECYDQIMDHKLYLDGLAYLGIVHTYKIHSEFGKSKPTRGYGSLIKSAGSIDKMEL